MRGGRAVAARRAGESIIERRNLALGLLILVAAAPLAPAGAQEYVADAALPHCTDYLDL